MKKEDIVPRNENGYPHGYWEVYHHNGQLTYKGCYIHGDPHGYWEVYWGNGQLCYKGLHINGKKHGYLVEYNPNGRLKYKEYYYMDEKVYQTSENKLLL